MKKFLLMLLVVGFITSCNNSSDNAVENQLDSLDERGDTLKNRVDSFIDTKIDSLKERKEQLKDRFDSTIERKKDSIKGKN